MPVTPDDDDANYDILSPPVVSRPVSPPPATPPLAPPPSIGRIGRTEFGPLVLSADPPDGLRRVGVPAAVRHAAPPESVKAPGCWFRWREGASRRFEMPVPAEVWVTAEPLAVWRDRVLTGVAPDRLPEPIGAVVDELADRLLTLTAALHAVGWRVGLLDPVTIYVVPTADPQLILPDFEFEWLPDEQPFDPDGFHPSQPSWLTGPDDVRRQLISPGGQAACRPPIDRTAAVREDLTAIAHLLQYIVAGRGTPLPTTGPLAQIENGGLTTADQLREVLRLEPLSGRRRIAKSKPPRSFPVYLLGVLAVLGVVTAGILYFLGRDDSVPLANPPTAEPIVQPTLPPPPTTPVENPKSTEDLAHALAALEKAPAQEARDVARAAWHAQFRATTAAMRAPDADPDPTVWWSRLARLAADLERIRRLHPPPDKAQAEEEERWLAYCRS